MVMTSGPTIGILPKNLERNGLAPLNAGAITPADLPNILAANPPTFAKPFVTNPFAPVTTFDAKLPNCGNNLVTNLPAFLIIFLAILNAFFIFLTIASKTFALSILNIKMNLLKS